MGNRTSDEVVNMTQMFIQLFSNSAPRTAMSVPAHDSTRLRSLRYCACTLIAPHISPPLTTKLFTAVPWSAITGAHRTQRGPVPPTNITFTCLPCPAPLSVICSQRYSRTITRHNVISLRRPTSLSTITPQIFIWSET